MLHIRLQEIKYDYSSSIEDYILVGFDATSFGGDVDNEEDSNVCNFDGESILLEALLSKMSKQPAA